MSNTQVERVREEEKKRKKAEKKSFGKDVEGTPTSNSLSPEVTDR